MAAEEKPCVDRETFSPERPRPKARTTDGGGQAAVAAGERFAINSPVAVAAAPAAAATRNQRRQGRSEEEAKARAADGAGIGRKNARVRRGSIAIATLCALSDASSQFKAPLVGGRAEHSTPRGGGHLFGTEILL
jgi:hypothetical protein